MTTKAITNKKKTERDFAEPGGSSAIKLQRLAWLKKQEEFNYQAHTVQ